MRRLLLALALLGVAVAAPAPDQAAAQGQRDPSRDPFAQVGIGNIDRSRTAFIYNPVSGEMRVNYNAKWQTTVIVYRPTPDGKSMNEVWRSAEMKSSSVGTDVGAHIVTAWARRTDKGPNEPWRQSQYEIKGIEGGFRIGFNDGREPKFDDAIVEFVWGTPGVVGSIPSARGTSGAQSKAEERFPQSGAGPGVPGAGAPAPAPGQGGQGPIPLPGGSAERGAR
jgi:hypothetical protein